MISASTTEQVVTSHTQFGHFLNRNAPMCLVARLCTDPLGKFSTAPNRLQPVQGEVGAVSKFQHQLDHCYGACTGCPSGSGSTSNSPNFVTWLLLSNSQATSLIWSAHTVSLACCDHPHRSFCPFRRTTWTLLLVVSLLLLRDLGTLFHWIVELLHPLTHLRSVLRHFSLIRHNRTVARASVLWRDINWLIDS